MNLSVGTITPDPAHTTANLGPFINQVITRVTLDTATDAKATAPVGQGPTAGHLRSSITPTINGAGAVTTGRVTADTPYAASVHEGAKPHPIQARNARVLRFPSRQGGFAYRPRVFHPGIVRPQPFLRDALRRVLDTLT